MDDRDRAPISWRTALAIVGGMTLIGWAVDDLLSWFESAALVFGVVLIGYAMAMVRRR